MADESHRRGTSTARTGEKVPSPRRGRRAVPAAAQAGHRSGGPRMAGRAGQRRSKRSRGKTIAVVAAVIVVIVAGLGTELYAHLDGNIKSVTISNAGTEKADAFGRTPINILMIGSDTRGTSQDCSLGGDCANGGQGANADVEMLVHIAADRSNATVVSIPRDVVTSLPGCTDSKSGQSVQARTGMINSALAYGPACQVAADHALTGVPIDHFMMVDFGGVVSMSDAIGGVPVCVNHNVYDTYSHLKLSRGTHTLKGVSALEFLRSRHGFGDGSDLGRTVAQHMYLASMVRTLKSAGTLTDPSALYGLADAGTKALTVDTGLNSIIKLIGLADDLSKVPSNRITFATMQTMADPADPNRVVVSPSARDLLNAMANDQSLTTGSGGKSGKAAATATASPAPPAVPDSQITVQVNNASGIAGRASAVAQYLVVQGFNPASTSGNAPVPASATSVHYPSGQLAQAQQVARTLHIPGTRLQQDSGVSAVTVIIGGDWTSGSTFPSTGGTGTSRPAPADAKAAVANADAQTASNSQPCAQVSTFDTVNLNGVPMTPTQAYADSPRVPNSAP